MADDADDLVDVELRVELTGHGRGKVWINGAEVRHVRSLQVSAASGDGPNRVVLELVPQSVVVVGPAGLRVEGRLPVEAAPDGDA